MIVNITVFTLLFHQVVIFFNNRERAVLPCDWCFDYERLVRFYKQQTTNMRSLCKTFADRAQQLLFTNVYLETHANTTITDKLFDMEQLTMAPILLHAKTEEKGLELKDFLSAQDNLSSALQDHYRAGIFLGTSRMVKLSQRKKEDIEYWIRQENPTVTNEELGESI